MNKQTKHSEFRFFHPLLFTLIMQKRRVYFNKVTVSISIDETKLSYRYMLLIIQNHSMKCESNP